MTNSHPERVVAYIDGFNLYFGIKERLPRRYRWLDLHASAKSLLKLTQVLVNVRYFTARISGPPKKQQRQETYLQALEATGRCCLHFGAYRSRSRDCRGCGNPIDFAEEKMTDVKIAVEMLADAYTDQFDTALLISGDTDVVPPVVKIRELFPKKRVIVAFPPGRVNNELKQVANGYIHIYQNSLVRLPECVTKPDGYVLACPGTWR